MGLLDKAPAWAYTKSKGFYAGIQLDGTVVIERNDENARFYGRKISAKELIEGKVGRPPGADGLIATVQMAEGMSVREERIPRGLPPSEMVASNAEPPTPKTSGTFAPPSGPPPPNPQTASSTTAMALYSQYSQPISSASSPPKSARTEPTLPRMSWGQHKAPLLPPRRTSPAPPPRQSSSAAQDNTYPPSGWHAQEDPSFGDPPSYEPDIVIGDNRTPAKN